MVRRPLEFDLNRDTFGHSLFIYFSFREPALISYSSLLTFAIERSKLGSGAPFPGSTFLAFPASLRGAGFFIGAFAFSAVFELPETNTSVKYVRQETVFLPTHVRSRFAVLTFSFGWRNFSP